MREFSRTALLLGEDKMERLYSARVAIFGIGGVGGHAAEAIARSGVGHILLVDSDSVSISNINRQIIATHETIGRKKVEVMQERILSINPTAQVEIRDCFYNAETADSFDFAQFDYIVDCIDSVSSKLMLIERALAAGTQIISSMGAGNKLDPSRFEIADIQQTSVCPLARVMRQQLRKRGIEHLTVVYSREPAIKPQTPDRAPASISFVPSVAGLMLAGEVVRRLAGIELQK
jgi:tRNA A37 threonylcarbamoyladenosine dehydratase